MGFLERSIESEEKCHNGIIESTRERKRERESSFIVKMMPCLRRHQVYF